MMKLADKLYSIVKGKCPRCHRDRMYQVRNPYRLDKLFSMFEHCSHCGLRYKMEPSFFFGAMYMSYGLGVVLAAMVFIVTYLMFGVSLLSTFMVIVAVLIGTMPIIARLGRNVWINLFVSYNPMYQKEKGVAKKHH